MSNIAATVKSILNENGTTQAWVVDRMNQINPDIGMNRSKFSAIVCGLRKMSGDELLAFCLATGANPDVFLVKPFDRTG